MTRVLQAILLLPLILPFLPSDARAYGARDAAARLYTSGQAGVVDGRIYVNPDALEFRLDLFGQGSEPGARAFLHHSPVDDSGSWTDIRTLPIPLTTSTGGSYPTTRGQVALQGLEPGVRHEFVVLYVEPGGRRIWLKPFIQRASADHAFYDLGPDYLHPEGMGGFVNGVFYPLPRPHVVIDYPQEDEVITWPSYEIRASASGSSNSVRVRIDDGDFVPCYRAAGHFWLHFERYAPGPHRLIAEAWNLLGQRFESAVRNVTYRP